LNAGEIAGMVPYRNAGWRQIPDSGPIADLKNSALKDRVLPGTAVSVLRNPSKNGPVFPQNGSVFV
jgi:hypothetical protein